MADTPNPFLAPDTAEPLAGANDLGRTYLAQQQVSEEDATIARFQQRFAPSKPDKPADEQAGGAPPPATPPAAAPTGGGTLFERGMAPPQLPQVQPGAGVTGRVLSDIGRGTIQAPRQVVGGASDALHNFATFASNIGDWLRDNGGGMTYPVDLPTLRNLLPGAGPIGSMLAAESDDRLKLLLSNPAKWASDLVPNIDKADTVTGDLVRGTAQFLTSLVVGSKVAGAFGVPAGTATNLVGGAVGDFAGRDPNTGRLSDLIESNPKLSNPVTRFMRSKPDDTEAEARLKNAVEGLGLAAAGNLLVAGIKATKDAIIAQGGQKAAQEFARDPLADARARYGEIKPTDMPMLGDPTNPALVVTGKLAAAAKATETGVPGPVAARGTLVPLGEDAGKQPVFVNFARINTADDVRTAIGQIAGAFPQEIKEAQRGVQTNAQTAALADELGLTVQDVLARQRGATMNAEQTLAARRLMNTTASQLVEAAKVASSPNASPADLFAFRKLLAVHTAVQSEVLGARTEAARALQAWSIPSDVGSIEMSRNVQSLVASMGGPEGTQELAARLAVLQANGATPAAVNGYIRASVLARSRDAIREAWVNGLLSGPKTHIANTSSNTLTAIAQVYERGVAEAISSARGATPGAGVAPGEALAMMYGITQSTNEAFKAAAMMFRNGSSSAPWARPMEERPMAISGQALGIGNDALSRTVDFIGKGVNLPSRFMGAEDEFFKTIAYRMELNAQAVRQTAAEGLTGKEAADRIQQILLNPPENIRLAAVDQALYQTFTNQTGAFGQSLLALRGNVPATAFVMPFVRTPVNISRYAFERSPLAPLVGQWRADIEAGGARADLALARMGTGTAMMLLGMDLADRGLITGGGYYSKDEGEKREALERQGWQKYSVKVGDKWVSYQRLDPFGMQLGFAADLVDIFKRAEISPDKIDEPSEILAAGIAAISSTVIDKTYMHGAADFFNMMSDPKRYGRKWVDQFTGSFVPAAVAGVEQAIDPTQRQAMTTWDYVMSRLPGLAASLPPKRDLWGAMQGDKSGVSDSFNAMSPVQVAQRKDSPIDAEMQRLAIGAKRIELKGDWDGVPVNFRDWPEVYDQYVKLAGNALEHPAWGIGAKDFLDQVVQGKHVMSSIYQMGSDGEEGGKSGFIKKTVAEYRKLARDAIMQDPKFSEFADYINREKAKRQEMKMPVLNQ